MPVGRVAYLLAVLAVSGSGLPASEWRRGEHAESPSPAQLPRQLASALTGVGAANATGTGDPNGNYSTVTGCTHGRLAQVYFWRKAGMGSNLNELMMTWMRGIVELGLDDVAVIQGSKQLQHVQCPGGEEGGPDTDTRTGLQCLFRPMPHLCHFADEHAYFQHMVSGGVPETDVRKMLREDATAARLGFRDRYLCSLDGGMVKMRSALEFLAGQLFSHLAPRLVCDMEGLRAAAPPPPPGPVVGLHIRHGDKRPDTGKYGFRPVQEYLASAREYLLKADRAPRPDWAGGGGGGGSGANALTAAAAAAMMILPADVASVFVASDDRGAAETIRRVAGSYFPAVGPDAVVYTTRGEEKGKGKGRGDHGGVGVAFQSQSLTYDQAVHLFFDMLQLSRADVFVGTYSSNLSRLVSLLRTGVEGKPPASEMSKDQPQWYPGATLPKKNGRRHHMVAVVGREGCPK